MTNVERLLQAQIHEGKTPGLQYLHVSPDEILVRYNDGVARVAGDIPVTRSTTFNGFSVTKTFTAVAILQLVERGLVQLDAPAQDFLPTFPYPGTITVRHLLAHSSGIRNPIPLRWIHLEHEHRTFDRHAFFARVYAQHASLAFTPDAKFAYANLGYQLLGELIERVTGQLYEQYVTQHILAPLGVPSAQLSFHMDPHTHARGYHKRLSVSYPLLGLLLDRSRSFEGREGAWQMFRPYHMNGAAYGGLVGTAEGFARFMQTLIAPQNVLLSAESTTQMFAEHVLSDGRPSGMSLSWFTGTLNGEPYRHHAGGGGAATTLNCASIRDSSVPVWCCSIARACRM